MTEMWLPVSGYEGLYEVSDLGRVRSVMHVVVRRNGSPYTVRTRILKPYTNESGHQLVNLHTDGKPSVQLAHRLMLKSFIGPCPPGMVACHGNDIPSDNRLLNLRWDTPTANALDHVRSGNHNQANKTHCIRNHPFDKSNTLVYSNRRECRTCRREKRQRSRARKKLAKQTGVIDCTTKINTQKRK